LSCPRKSENPAAVGRRTSPKIPAQGSDGEGRAGRDRPARSAECLRPNFSKPNQIQTKPDQENGLGFSWIPSSYSGLFNELRAVQIKKELPSWSLVGARRQRACYEAHCLRQWAPRDKVRRWRVLPQGFALGVLGDSHSVRSKPIPPKACAHLHRRIEPFQGFAATFPAGPSDLSVRQPRSARRRLLPADFPPFVAVKPDAHPALPPQPLRRSTGRRASDLLAPDASGSFTHGRSSIEAKTKPSRDSTVCTSFVLNTIFRWREGTEKAPGFGASRAWIRQEHCERPQRSARPNCAPVPRCRQAVVVGASARAKTRHTCCRTLRCRRIMHYRQNIVLHEC